MMMMIGSGKNQFFPQADAIISISFPQSERPAQTGGARWDCAVEYNNQIRLHRGGWPSPERKGGRYTAPGHCGEFEPEECLRHEMEFIECRVGQITTLLRNE